MSSGDRLEQRVRAYLAERDAEPPPPGLEERILHNVRATGAHPNPKRSTVAQLLIAAVLVVIAVGLLFATRLLPRPSSPANESSQVASELQQLRQRPLTLPGLNPDGSCPVTSQQLIPVFLHPGDTPTVMLAYGNHGPIYGLGGSGPQTPRGYYYNVTWLSDVSYSGLALVRGRELNGPRPIMFSGPLATGSPVLADTIGGQSIQFLDELVLPPAHSRASAWRSWGELQGVQGPGCYAFQIDGPSFEDIIVVDV